MSQDIMSSKIHILPDLLMKRIAAGEVIERPASAIKELMENAVDAGAEDIRVMIKDSGLGLIQVVDNGEGMTEEEALLCCERHATSKIARMEDLERIRTLGFRGEALASIASVSRMTVTTATEDVTEGTEVRLHGGAVEEILKLAPRKGTSVSVKDLFFNVPARRKFLKSPTTEFRHCLTMFRRIALAFPEIAFTLFVEGERSIQVTPSTTEGRVAEMLSRQTASGLVSLLMELPSIRIEGMISRPESGRKSRENQFLYLNRRAIQHRSIFHAVQSAYGPRLPGGKYPSFVLFIEMNPEMFDVNVHPTKIEVRFADDKLVYDTVKRACHDALRIPAPSPSMRILAPGRPGKASKASYSETTQGQMNLEVQRYLLGERSSDYRSKEDVAPLWQLHRRYILSQIKSGLVIIDQHVAHERVLYERALRSHKESIGFSQQLLFPQTVHLSQEDMSVLTEILPYLERIGFGIREFGKSTVVIEAVPTEIKTGEERERLLEILDTFKELRETTTDAWDAVAKSFACRSAIKSGERLSREEMESLVDQLFATEEPYFCPHGRPIVVNIGLEELDKRFGR